MVTGDKETDLLYKGPASEDVATRSLPLTEDCHQGQYFEAMCFVV